MVLQRKYAETKRRKNKSLKTVTIARRFGALRPRVKTRSFEEIPLRYLGRLSDFQGFAALTTRAAWTDRQACRNNAGEKAL